MCKSKSSEYATWYGMKQRCHNPEASSFRTYGAKGITVCDQWIESFDSFLADMGPKPTPKHSIDRIDPAGDYSPENCRWATWQEQADNNRNTHKITVDGETKTLREWSAMCGVSANSIRWRLAHGWNPKKAVTVPFEKPFCKKGHDLATVGVVHHGNGAKTCRVCYLATNRAHNRRYRDKQRDSRNAA